MKEGLSSTHGTRHPQSLPVKVFTWHRFQSQESQVFGSEVACRQWLTSVVAQDETMFPRVFHEFTKRIFLKWVARPATSWLKAVRFISIDASFFSHSANNGSRS